MEQIIIKQNDKLYDVIFELVNNDNTPLDLTGNTNISLHAKRTDGTGNILNNNCNVVGSVTTGICKYTVQATDFTAPGYWNAEIQITYASGEIITVPTFQIIVESEII